MNLEYSCYTVAVAVGLAELSFKFGPSAGVKNKWAARYEPHLSIDESS